MKTRTSSFPATRHKLVRTVPQNGRDLQVEKLSRRQSVDMKKQKDPFVPSSKSPQVEKVDVDYLLGKPRFDVILSKSHVGLPYQFVLPASIVHMLPRATVPAVLRCCGKNWDLSYIGDGIRPRFDYKWKRFATENDLKCGDACVFELMENNDKRLKFKVHILRCDFPPELLAAIDSRDILFYRLCTNHTCQRHTRCAPRPQAQAGAAQPPSKAHTFPQARALLGFSHPGQSWKAGKRHASPGPALFAQICFRGGPCRCLVSWTTAGGVPLDPPSVTHVKL